MRERFLIVVGMASLMSVTASAQNGVLRKAADGRSFVMSAESGPVGLFLASDDQLIACQFAKGRNGEVSTSRSRALVVYDLKTGREQRRVPFAGELPILFTDCSSDGRYVVTSSKKQAQQIDLQQGTVVRSWPLKAVFGVPTISPDNRTLALSDDRTISLYDLSTGEKIKQLASHPSRIIGVAFNDAGDKLLSSCMELTRIWDVSSGRPTNLPFTEPFRRLSIDASGSTFFGRFQRNDSSGGAACFDVRSGRRLTFLENHFATATDFRSDRWFTIDGGKNSSVDAVQVRSASQPQSVRYLPFDPEVRRLASRLASIGQNQLELSPDGRYLLARFEYGKYSQVWTLDDGTDQQMIASAEGLKHQHRPTQAKPQNKSREQQFLDEIWGIREKVAELKEAGKVAEAEREIESLLAAGERRLQRAPRRHQLLIRNCAEAYSGYLGQREKGLAQYYRALALAESGKRFDRDWEGLISQIATEQSAKGDRQAACKTYQQIIDHRQSSGQPIKASQYSRLAQLTLDPTNLLASDETLKLYHKAWVASQQETGALGMQTRVHYDRLVSHVRMVGGWDKLEDVLVKQLAEYERFKGATHPQTARAALQLAQLYERLGNPVDALKMMDRSQRALRDHVARVLPSMSDSEQRDFLSREFQPALDAAFAMAVRLQKQPGVAGLSASWIVNAKGTATRALAERARVSASTNDPEVRQIAIQLADVREQLSSLGLASLGGDESDGRSNELEQLRQTESELSWKLGLAGWTELRQDPWASVDEIRKKIPSDSVLIELAITGLSEKREEKKLSDIGRDVEIGLASGTPKVVAWIIPPAGKGSVRMGVLCDDISELARPLLLFHAAVSGQIGGPRSGAVSEAFLAEMSQHLVFKLPPDVLRAKRWMVSPDHLLWFVPWAALPEPDGNLVVKRHEVQYLLSGRDLLTLPTAESQAAPLIVANPDYGSGASRQVAFTPLPGTKAEAKGVYPYLRRLAGADPNVFVGARAKESVVKASKRPRVALFSTHGFASFDPEQHPMATCGLAFSGANAAIEGTGDGVLTGLEILASDYRGTDLVVLSACQTALGDLSSGEGVASLRYAFQLAGAKNVAGTLWSIPDAITAEMMKDFFQHYANGRTPAASLRLAQLATIQRLEKQGVRPDPSLWAAFTIAGPPSEGAASDGSFQTWRSADGQFTIDAEFISSDDDQVVLRKLDGAEIQVSLDQLHPDDRASIIDLTRGG